MPANVTYDRLFPRKNPSAKICRRSGDAFKYLMGMPHVEDYIKSRNDETRNRRNIPKLLALTEPPTDWAVERLLRHAHAKSQPRASPGLE